MSYSTASPLYDPVLARVQRIMFRKMTLTDIALDVIVCLALTAVVIVQRLVTSALLFDQLNDSWTTPQYWKVYLPSTLNGMLLPWVYCTVMYHLFPLLGAFIVIAAIVAFIDLIFLFWLVVDWFDCKNVLWCANLSYWTTDPVTKAKIFGPLINGSARWEFVVAWVMSALFIGGIGLLIYLALTLYNILYYRNRAIMQGNTSMPVTDAQELGY